MKRISVLAALGLLASFSLSAQPRASVISPSEHPGRTRLVSWYSQAGASRSMKTVLDGAPDAGGSVADLLASASRSAGMRTQSVIDETDSFALVLPVAISSPGRNGTYFRTDASLCNYRSVDQVIAVGWLPAGASAAGAGLTYFTLQANSVYMVRDFLGSGGIRLNRSGVGSVIISGMYPGTTNVDSSARLDASLRIWTYEPGSSGTNSFSVEPTSGSVMGHWYATALGLRHDSGFRTNVGIVNMDADFAHTWSVRVVGMETETTFTVTVLSLSMVQLPVPNLGYGDLFVEFTPQDMYSDSTLWAAYAVTADNLTGDSWLSRAVQ